MTALTLLLPGTPMLFQGQEFAASAPFLFFADHNPDLAKLVHRGRNEFLAQFPSLGLPEVQEHLVDPAALTTFESCKLDFSERESHAAVYALHRDLLALRRSDPVFKAQRRRGLDGAVLDQQSFVIRFFDDQAGDRLLIVNWRRPSARLGGRTAACTPARHQTLKPGSFHEDVKSGGQGAPSFLSENGLRIPAESALVALPVTRGE